MSERDYEAEAREIAAGMSWNVDAIEDDACMFYYGPHNECVGFAYGGAIWDALLYSVRLARQPRGLPAEVPEWHERVRIGLCHFADTGWQCVVEHDSRAWRTPYIVVTADLPLPRAVEIVGSVEP